MVIMSKADQLQNEMGRKTFHTFFHHSFFHVRALLRSAEKVLYKCSDACMPVVKLSYDKRSFKFSLFPCATSVPGLKYILVFL